MRLTWSGNAVIILSKTLTGGGEGQGVSQGPDQFESLARVIVRPRARIAEERWSGERFHGVDFALPETLEKKR